MLFALSAYAGLPGPWLKVELGKPDDSAAITSTQNACVVAITSKSGIGNARLIRTGTAWPAGITIRLALRNLESFEMRNGRFAFETSLKRSGQVPFWKDEKDGKPGAQVGDLEVTVTKIDDAIEVVVPEEMMEGNPPEMQVKWINEYRQ